MVEGVADAQSSAKSRNARACEACRASKSRCIRTNEKDVCAKCELNGMQCIIRSKARPMRVRNPRRDSSSGTSKHIVAIKKDSEFSIDLPPVIAPDSSEIMDELHDHHKRVLGDDDGIIKPPPVEKLDTM